jgi:hypothetical protein
MYSGGVVQSGVTTAANYYETAVSTVAAAFTCANLRHYLATQGTIGAGSAVTIQQGFYAASSLTGAASNFGFYGDIAAAATRWNLYMNGTAQNYIAGFVGLGTATVPATMLELRGDNTSGSVTTIRFTDTDTAIALDQQIGRLDFFSNDATPGASIRASILCAAEDVSGGSYIAFSTASGAAAPVEMFRVISSGVYISGATYAVVAPFYQPQPATKTADFVVGASETFLICNKAAASCTVTLPDATVNAGRILYFVTYQAFAVISNASNVVPRTGAAAGTAITGAADGSWAILVSNGTSWCNFAGI